jgi:dTDP-6-deoxy-L-talose 4-dehydrogenase (NAD+)
MKKSRSFNFTWARLFYLYGEGQGLNSLYSQLKAAIASGKSEFDMSRGEQLRDYMAASEAAEILVELAVSRKDIGVVNLCSGRPISVRSLVEGWLEELGCPVKLNLGCFPYPDYEPLAFWGGRDKLDRLLEQL